MEDRGYWFNGECQFLTIEGFSWSLSPVVTAWLKIHSLKGTFLTFSNDDTDHWTGPEYTRIYHNADETNNWTIDNNS